MVLTRAQAKAAAKKPVATKPGRPAKATKPAKITKPTAKTSKAAKAKKPAKATKPTNAPEVIDLTESTDGSESGGKIPLKDTAHLVQLLHNSAKIIQAQRIKEEAEAPRLSALLPKRSKYRSQLKTIQKHAEMSKDDEDMMMVLMHDYHKLCIQIRESRDGKKVLGPHLRRESVKIFGWYDEDALEAIMEKTQRLNPETGSIASESLYSFRTT